MNFSQPAVDLPDDVRTPVEPTWAPFTHAVLKLLTDWDVMQNAESTGFGAGDPAFSKAKVVEYLLANFASKWKDKKVIDPVEVNKFLILTMDDFFQVDIGNSAYPLAKVLVKIYGEAVNGQTTGLQYILQKVASRPVASSAPSSVAQSPREGVSKEAVNDEAIVNVSKALEKVEVSHEGPDEDGWETVGRKKRNRRRNQGQ